MTENNLADYLFNQGTNYYTYDYLGCSHKKIGKKHQYTFRVWAPNADAVYLVSDFTGWSEGVPLQKVSSGVFELVYFADVILEKKPYKYKIVSKNGKFYKGDPYARFSRGLDDGASLICTESNFKWSDLAWRKYRKRTFNFEKNALSTPINIYEVHFGSFARKDDGSAYSYREMADILVPYVKSMGYTHVEFLPLQEHPYGGSWGYQVCGFYAPTSRYGDPDDFKYLIDSFHRAGIGVIMDWVPAHFPKDAWGLYEFDGSPLYEYQGDDRMESHSWGTRFFDLGREQVQSFLISNALFWLREFHIDGLRVDAVASMLYLDYDRTPGEWIPNSYGNNINLEAVAFFKKLNGQIFAEFPDALMIAEESGSYSGITKSLKDGGLGFTLKWNMGWANDFYDYVSSDPVYRKYKHKALNFPIMYAFTEKYCLPVSHDEVVHGKKSFIDKMYGSYEDKFLQARSALLLMMTYPGKKLLFMGTEYAQFREWNYDDSLEWFMLDYPSHKCFRDYVIALNTFYLSHEHLWTDDFTSAGFGWVYADEANKNIVAYKRYNKCGEFLLTAISFSGERQTIDLQLDNPEEYEIIFATDQNSDLSITGSVLTLPAFCGAVLGKKKDFENIAL